MMWMGAGVDVGGMLMEWMSVGAVKLRGSPSEESRAEKRELKASLRTR